MYVDSRVPWWVDVCVLGWAYISPKLGWQSSLLPSSDHASPLMHARTQVHAGPVRGQPLIVVMRACVDTQLAFVLPYRIS